MNINAAAVSNGQQRQASPVVNLALQGGGSHGAFTWGVLDALLEDGRVALEGISGTSAGAMNAVAMAHGFGRVGPKSKGDPREAAREALASFWNGIVDMGVLSEVQRAPFDVLFGKLGGAGAHPGSKDMKILTLAPFSQLGAPMELVKAFGGKAGYTQAVAELEAQLYEQRKA